MAQVPPCWGSSIALKTAVLQSLNERVKSFCVYTLLAGNAYCFCFMMGLVFRFDYIAWELPCSTGDKNLNVAILIFPSVMDLKQDCWCLHLLPFVL